MGKGTGWRTEYGGLWKYRIGWGDHICGSSDMDISFRGARGSDRERGIWARGFVVLFIRLFVY